MPLRVLMLIQRFGWAFENIARALQRRVSDGAEVTLADHSWQRDAEIYDADWDVVVTMWWREAEHARGLLRARRHVVCVYDYESWRGDEEVFRRALSGADLVACANPVLRDLVRPYVPASARVLSLPDGVDVDRFPLLPNPKTFVVGWTGNSRAMGEGVGRSDDHKGLGLIRAACEAEGIPLVVRDLADGPPLPHADMSAGFYAQIACYACASLSEGTPNPPLEALASGKPVVTTDVGLMADTIKPGACGIILRERSVEALREALRTVRGWFDRTQGTGYPGWIRAACRAAAEGRSWDRAAADWWAALGLICRGRSNPTPVVTAVLVSSGEPTEVEALRRLQDQDLLPVLSVVRNVRPMDAAFRAMADQVLTPYFVQVDADMLLEPGAIARLLRAIKAAPPDVALHCEWLWGDLEEMPIQGVKIYRTEAVRSVPWRSCVSCEVDQLARWREVGRTLSCAPCPTSRAGCVGEHRSAPDPDSAFRRWRRLMMKRRAGAPVAWVDAYPERFRARWLAAREVGDPRAPVLEAAWLGAVAGLHAPLDGTEADASDVVCHSIVRRVLGGPGIGPQIASEAVVSPGEGGGKGGDRRPA